MNMDRKGIPGEGRYALSTNNNQEIFVGWKRATLDLKNKPSVAVDRWWKTECGEGPENCNMSLHMGYSF
jgi:hypothetical protein